jgi:hypothetical protein
LTVGDGAGDTRTAATTGSTTEALAFCTAVLAGSTTPVLIRGTSTGSISTASATPTDAANWSAVYPIANTSEVVNGLVEHDGQVYVSTSAGLFAVDANVNGTSLTRHLTNSSNTQTGRPCIEWHGKVYYPHHTGLYRTVNGLTRTVGIEVLPNYLAVPSAALPRGRVTAMAGTAHWLYIAIYNGASSWILAGREREAGEPGVGEMVWHSLYGGLSGEIGAMCIYQGTDSVLPRLYFGLGAALRYFTLGKEGGPELGQDDVEQGAKFHYFAPNDLGHPATLKVAEQIEFSNVLLDAGDDLTLNAVWERGPHDGGTASQVGATLTGAASGRQTFNFTKGTNDSGRKLFIYLSLDVQDADTNTYLDGGYCTVRGRERPDQVREVTMVLDLTEGATVPQGQTLLELEAQLRTWKESGTALTFTDNQSGETFTCRMQEVVRDESESDVGATPGYRVRVRLVEALN